MKKIAIVVFFILWKLSCLSQIYLPPNVTGFGNHFRRALFDSVLHIPEYFGDDNIHDYDTSAQIRVNDGILQYYYGGVWHSLGSSSDNQYLTPGYGLLGTAYNGFFPVSDWTPDSTVWMLLSKFNSVTGISDSTKWVADSIVKRPYAGAPDGSVFLIDSVTPVFLLDGTTPNPFHGNEKSIATLTSGTYSYDVPSANDKLAIWSEYTSVKNYRFTNNFWVFDISLIPNGGIKDKVPLDLFTLDNRSVRIGTNGRQRTIYKPNGDIIDIAFKGTPNDYYAAYDSSTGKRIVKQFNPPYVAGTNITIVGDTINSTGDGGSETWQQTLINGSELTQDNLSNVHGYNFEMDSLSAFNLYSGDISFSGNASNIGMGERAAILYSQLDGSTSASIFTGTIDSVTAQLNAHDDTHSSNLSVNSNGAMSVKGVLDSSTDTAPNLVGIDIDGNWHKYSPFNQRFGIEDNLGLQDRYVNHQGFGMQLDSLSYFEADNYDGSDNYYFNVTNLGFKARSGGITNYSILEVKKDNVNIGSRNDGAFIKSWQFNVSPDSATVIFQDSGFTRTQRFSHPINSNYYIPLSVNGNYADNTGNITVSAGSGVTSFGKVDNWGITSSVANPTSTPVHTIGVDSSASGLSGKYVRLTDSLNIYGTPKEIHDSEAIYYYNTAGSYISRTGGYSDVGNLGVTSASGDVAIGKFAFENKANSTLSVAIGWAAGSSDASGSTTASIINSVDIGFFAGSGVLTDSSSISIGTIAGRGYTGHVNDIAIGAGALTRVLSGARPNSKGNIAIGTNSLFSTGSAYYLPYNIAIGTYAGARTTFGTPIVLGFNNILLGNGVSLPSGTANTLNIGNILYGTGLTFDSTATLGTSTTVSTPRIGIGIISPTNTLDVNGDVRVRTIASTTLNDDVLVTESGVIKSQSVNRISATKAHTIFAPTTGGTVSLVNNQYNIINPAGALVALTVNLPSSPANNDVVYIKYTQSVTTVTYGNGTVVDGITSPVGGGLVVLTFDSGTTSWY